MKWKTALLGFLAGIANGLFGSGGGTLVVPILESREELEAHQAHATAIFVILPLTFLSLFFYLKANDFDPGLWKNVLWVSGGGVIGGFLGAKVLKNIPGKTLHKIFGIFMLIAAVRMWTRS